MKHQNELIADKVYDLIKYAIYSEDFYGDISEKIEEGISEATAPLQARIKSLEAEKAEEKEKGFRIAVQFMNERLWMAFRGNFMTSSIINDQEKEIYRILNGITEDVVYRAKYFLSILPDPDPVEEEPPE